MSDLEHDESQDRIDTAVKRQALLLSLLACPTCQGPIELIDPAMPHGAVVKADLFCGGCGLVGLIEGYRPSFLARDRDDSVNLRGLAPEWVPLNLSSLAHTSEWAQVPEGVRAVGSGAAIGGLVRSTGVRFELLTHPWSGRVELRFAGQTRSVDLGSDEVGTKHVVFSGEVHGEHAWSLALLDGGSRGTEQVILRAIYRYVSEHDALPPQFIPENFGNPYPPRFEEILAALPPDARVLDLGGGDRRHPDHRVLNLEYLPYRRVDLYGDGLQLPFADDSFDFILSQAVLEHVPEPQRAVDEIRRVLKPGATVWAEFAFMQPLHAVPFHFFNITPHGASLLFEKFDDVAVNWFGGLGETMRWFFRLVDAETKLGTEAVGQVLDGLDVLDARLTSKDLSLLASAVSVEARAPFLR